MPILEAISNSISALPIATSVGQPASGQRAPGGFASTLAAAQNQSNSQPATGSATRSALPASKIAGVAGNPDLRTQGSGNSQAKKLPLAGPAAANSLAAVNTVVPQVVPIPVSQTISALPNLSQLNLAPVPASSISGVQVPQATADAVHPSLQMTPQPAVKRGTPAGNLGVSQTAMAASSLTRSESAGAQVTNPSEITGLVPNGNWRAAGPESANSNSPSTLTALPNPSPDTQWNRAPSASGSVGAMTGNDIRPNAASTTEQPAAASALPAVVADQQRNVFVTNGIGSSPAELTLASIGTVGFASSAPTILAQTTSNSGAAAPPAPAMGKEIAPASLSNAPALQSGLPPQAAVESTSSGAVGDLATAATVLNPSDALGMGKAEPQFAAPKALIAVDVPGTSKVEQHATAPASTLSSAAAAVLLSQQSPLASQTPFSIFFSGPGPGTESAAGTLPKMLLPTAGSASGGHHNAGSDSSSMSAPTNVSQNGGAHNPVPQNLRGPAVPAESATLQAGQLRPGGDGNAASAEPAMAPVATASAPAVTTSAVTLPAGATPFQIADPLGKTVAAPTPPGGASATAVAETLPVRLAGPVQMAQLISRVEQAEMRIGMSTSAFGSVEVRAVVHANDVGLVVGSEKGDLRTLLSNELPAIANTLQEQNLRLHSVNFMQGFAFSNNTSGGNDSQPQPFIPLRVATDIAARELKVDESNEPVAPVEWSGGHNNLSILA